ASAAAFGASCSSGVRVVDAGAGGSGGATGSTVTDYVSTSDGPPGPAVTSTQVSDGTTTVAVTTTSAVTTGAGPCGGGMSSGDPTCDDCMFTSCCDALGYCASDPQCGLYIDCLSACADKPCVDQCAADFPDGVSDTMAISQCEVDACVDV